MKKSIHPIRSNHDSCTETLHLLDDVDPGEVEADEDGETKEHGAGGHQVPQPAKDWGEGAQHSQQHYSTVLWKEQEVT